MQHEFEVSFSWSLMVVILHIFNDTYLEKCVPYLLSPSGFKRMLR